MDAEELLRADDGGVARVERKHNVAVAVGSSKCHFPLDLHSSHLSRTPGQTLSSAGSAVGDMGHEGIVTLCSVCLSSSVVLRHGLASSTGIAHVRRVPRLRPDTVVESDVPIGYRLRRRSGIGRLKVETPMRSGPVVVLGVRAEDALQVATTEDEDVVETLSSNGPDPSLGERVRPRRTDGCLHRRKSFRSKHFIERI
jgi:hypothetical protein